MGPKSLMGLKKNPQKVFKLFWAGHRTNGLVAILWQSIKFGDFCAIWENFCSSYPEKNDHT